MPGRSCWAFVAGALLGFVAGFLLSARDPLERLSDDEKVAPVGGLQFLPGGQARPGL